MLKVLNLESALTFITAIPFRVVACPKLNLTEIDLLKISGVQQMVNLF